MADSKYLTAPQKMSTMPPGIPYIIGNEAAERFNFYGMRAVLVVFMTQYLVNRSGAKDVMTENDANKWYHLFLSANYFFPMLGAIVSDAFFGKYRTIFWVSLVYCSGSLVLALDHTRLGLGLGLGLIALGAGGIKPCVSSHVGDQFGSDNQHLLARAFGWFYFSVNFGSFFSILLIPWLLEHYGAGWAFGVPAVLMLLAACGVLVGPRQVRAHPARGRKEGVPARRFQPRRLAGDRPAGHSLRLRCGVLVAVGPERRRMGVAGREDGPALRRHQLALFPDPGA